jgi:hypothetical protein
VKRFLVLLVLMAGGLAAAAFAVPSNAAVVNGVAITQSQLDTQLSAIANSKDNLYGCYLSAQEAVDSQGESGLPPVEGVGQADDGGAHPTATTAFAATYLDTVIGHQLVSEMAATRHVVLTSADLATARTALESEITSVLQDVSGSSYACGPSSETLTGQEVLATMPPSFVADDVRFDASVSVLEEKLSGVGSSPADLRNYFDAHRALFNTDAFTVAGYSSLADAQAAVAKVAAGASFTTVASAVAGGGPEGSDILYGIESQLPASAKLSSLPVNTLSAPISYNGEYLLVEITSSAPTPYTSASGEVEQAVQGAGATATQKALQEAELRASISLDPRYGTWTQSDARIIVPPSPVVDDVLNPAVNSAGTATTTSPSSPSSTATGSSGSATSSSGQTG